MFECLNVVVDCVYYYCQYQQCGVEVMLLVGFIGDMMQVDMLCVVGIGIYVGDNVFGVKWCLYECLCQMLEGVLLFLCGIVIQWC